MKPKVVLVILIVLLVLFVAGLVLGGAVEDGLVKQETILERASSDDEQGGRRVQRQEMRASPAACLQQDVLTLSPGGGSCVLTVGPSEASNWAQKLNQTLAPLLPKAFKGRSADIRTLALDLASEHSVRVRIEQRGEKDSITVERDLTKDEPQIKVQVYGDGAEVTIDRCQAPSESTCQLRVLE
jgi:hypothetical protein